MESRRHPDDQDQQESISGHFSPDNLALPCGMRYMFELLNVMTRERL
jgi:hypothetical protein